MQVRRGIHFCPRCGQEHHQQVGRGHLCSLCYHDRDILRHLPRVMPLQPAYYRIFPGKNS